MTKVLGFMKTEQYVTVLFRLILIFLVFLVFFQSLAFIILISKIEKVGFSKTQVEGEKITPSPSKYTRIDSIHNKTTTGIIVDGKDSGYNIFFDEIGVKSLFSDSRENEYFCTGSCYCDENGLRRLVSTSKSHFVSGLLFLVSSISTVLAVQKASDYFSDECENILKKEESCSYESVIHAEVDTCETMEDFEKKESLLLSSEYSPFEESDTKDPEIMSLDQVEDGSPSHTEYECIGNCVHANLRKVDFWADTIVEDSIKDGFWDDIELKDLAMGNMYYYRSYRSVYDLEQSEMGNEMHIAARPLVEIAKKLCYSLQLKMIVSTERVGAFEYQEENAAIKFASIHLHKFCKSQSVFTLQHLFVTPYDMHGLEGFEMTSFQKKFMKYYLEFMGEHPSRGFALCKAKRFNDFQMGGLNVVCFRRFTPEEWERGVPYENNNLRHWKESHKRYPEIRKYKRIYQ